MGKVTTSPLPFWVCPPLQRGGKIRSGPQMGNSATSALASRGSPLLQSRVQNQKWPKWLHHPCRLGDLQRCRAQSKIRSGPLVGEVATSPLPSRGSPPLQSGKEKQKWPTYGQRGYVKPAHLGDLQRCRGAAKSEVAHKWATRLRQPWRLGDPHCFRVGGKIRGGPLVGKVARSPLPSR